MSLYEDNDKSGGEIFDTGELRYLAKKSIYVGEEYSLDDIIKEYSKSESIEKKPSAREEKSLPPEEGFPDRPSVPEVSAPAPKPAGSNLAMKTPEMPEPLDLAELFGPAAPAQPPSAADIAAAEDEIPDVIAREERVEMPEPALQKAAAALEEKEAWDEFFSPVGSGEPPEERRKERRSPFETFGDGLEDGGEKKAQSEKDGPDDYKKILKKLKKSRVLNTLSILLSGILAGLLAFFAFTGGGYGALYGVRFGYLFSVRAQLLLFFLAVLLAGHDMLKSAAGLLKAKADGYTLLFFSSLAVLAQGIALSLHTESPPESIIFYGVVTALGIFFSRIGKQMELRALSKHAASLDSARELYCLKSYYRDDGLDEIKKLDTEEKKTFALKARTRSTCGFMRLAQGENDTNVFYSYAVPILVSCIIVTALLLTLFADRSQNESLPLLVIAALGAIVTPFSFSFVYNLPFLIAARRVSKYGAVLLGGAAAREFSGSGGVILSEEDLFDRSNVALKSIKVYSDTSFDETIIRTACVLSNYKTSLSELFQKIVDDPEKIQRAEITEFASGEGITANVGKIKLTIGSGEYLYKSAVNISADLAKSSYKARQKGLVPMFVAENGELKCVFVLRYKGDPDAVKQIRRLCDQGISVYVNTFDANLSTTLLQTIFDVKSGGVRVIRKEVAEELAKSMELEENSHCGVYMTDSRSESYCETVLETKRLKKIVRRNLIIQTACMVTAPIAVLILTLIGGVAQASPAYILLFLSIWTLPVLINSLVDLL